MPPSLLDSQLATLEIADDLLVVQAAEGVEATAQRVVSALNVG
jgi:gluconate kinase